MRWRRRIYLDYAAGASANPSSPHAEGREARRVLQGARTDIARLVEAQADDVIFTSGATEANALAILGLAKPGAHVLYAPSAHASVVENIRLAEKRGVVSEPLPIRDSRIDITALGALLRPETVLVSMDAVCGETGVVWNTREVQNMLGKAYLHVDASQAPLTEKIVRSHFGADLLTLDGAKVGASRGIGALIASRALPLSALYGGGGQERGLRPGSEAPALAAEFAACLQQAADNRESFRSLAERVRSRIKEKILKHIPDSRVIEGRAQAPHILNVSLPGRDTDYLVALLDEAGFAVATRSACETDSEEGSRAVLALTGDPELARATVRISWGPDVRPCDLERFAEVFVREVAFIDSTGRR